MYEWLVPRVVLPLVDRATGRRVGGRLQDLRDRQWQSDDERDGIAVARLRRLLDHAAAHVPYYGRRLGDAGVGSGDIRSLADLARVPITTKRDLVAAGLAGTTAETLAAARGRLITTSGSSGAAFRFYVDMAAEDTRLATYLLALEWAGVAIWTPEIRVNSPFRDVSWVYGRPGSLARLGRRMLLGQRTFRMVAPRPTVADLEALIRRAERSGAFFMWGFSSLLALLGEQVLRAGTTLPSYPRAVVSRGERLTEVRRRTIRSAFQAPVVDHYGCTEMADLAQSCPDAPDGLHVLSDRVIIQVVREDGRPAGPGERGRVLLTDLENHVMPFINYAVGDFATVGSSCACGRGLTALVAIDGRESEVIRLPGGGQLSAFTLESCINAECDVGALSEFQIVQTAPERVVVKLVTTPRFTGEEARRLKQAFERILGPDVSVEMEEDRRFRPSRPGSGSRSRWRSARDGVRARGSPDGGRPAAGSGRRRRGPRKRCRPVRGPRQAAVGFTIVAHTDTIRERPDLVRRVVAATLRGFADAAREPDAAVRAVTRLAPMVDAATAGAQLPVDLSFLFSPANAGRRVGFGPPEDWRATLDLLKRYREIDTVLPAEAFYTNEFVP